MAEPYITLENVERFCNFVQNAERIVVIVHANPDGDAIGTSIALKQCLKAIGKEITIIAPNPFPDFLHWMHDASKIIIYKHATDTAKTILNTADLIICVDFNNLTRLDEMGKYIFSLPVPRMLIDHHLNPAKEEFVLCFSDIKASSSAEVLYNLIKKMELVSTFNLPAIEAIYTGMMTDTNNFQHNCSHPDTFRTIAELLEYGIDKSKIHESVYNNYSEHRLRLMGYALEQKMTILHNYHTAYIALSHAELEKFKFRPGDTEGFVNYPLSINGIILSCFISENPENVRLSFRSRGSFSVNNFSRQHFDGGGHKNAAGGISWLSLEETINKFINSLIQYKDELAVV